jgi:predicted RNase H-like HicB family nuclease
MSTSIWGVVEGGRVIPSSALPEGTRVEIRLPATMPDSGTSEGPNAASIDLTIASFRPEPFEVVKPFEVVIREVEGGYEASFIEANIGTTGDTRHEALENLKDLILMIFRDFEGEDDATLGPAMRKQRDILSDFIRRTP